MHYRCIEKCQFAAFASLNCFYNYYGFIISVQLIFYGMRQAGNGMHDFLHEMHPTLSPSTPLPHHYRMCFGNLLHTLPIEALTITEAHSFPVR